MKKKESNTQESFKAGPYKAPKWKIGKKVFDEWLGVNVEVAEYTDAPIPWPGHIHQGRLMPILARDLVRAVVEEPEGVVARYFGVSKYHIDLWKRAISGATNASEVHAALVLKRFDPTFRVRYGYKDRFNRD